MPNITVEAAVRTNPRPAPGSSWAAGHRRGRSNILKAQTAASVRIRPRRDRNAPRVANGGVLESDKV